MHKSQLYPRQDFVSFVGFVGYCLILSFAAIRLFFGQSRFIHWLWNYISTESYKISYIPFVAHEIAVKTIAFSFIRNPIYGVQQTSFRKHQTKLTFSNFHHAFPASSLYLIDLLHTEKRRGHRAAVVVRLNLWFRRLFLDRTPIRSRPRWRLFYWNDHVRLQFLPKHRWL